MTGRSSRKATIHDIAEAAGISTTTVSIVLNGLSEKYRISAKTAERIRKISNEYNYSANSKARALRLAKSGIVGMLIPHYRNSLFTGLAEAFEVRSRSHGFCPLVASTQRNPDTEQESIRSLLRQDVEFLFLVGMGDSDTAIRMAREHGTRFINIDLPGTSGPSIVTDHRLGATMLTERIVRELRMRGIENADELYFIGGVAGEYATEERLAGFLEIAGRPASLGQKDFLCSYRPEEAAACLSSLVEKTGRLPRGIFVNSSPALTGIIPFLLNLDVSEYKDMVIGCFDWEPFFKYLPFLTGAVRHDVAAIMDEAFRVAVSEEFGSQLTVKIPPNLELPREIPAPQPIN